MSVLLEVNIMTKAGSFTRSTGEAAFVMWVMSTLGSTYLGIGTHMGIPKARGNGEKIGTQKKKTHCIRHTFDIFQCMFLVL